MASVSPWRLQPVSGFGSNQAMTLAAPRRRRPPFCWRAHAGDKRGGGHWSRRQTRQTSTSKDHYGVLGVGSDASAADIKLAFRQLARKYHPDVNKELGAPETFKTVRHAYEILSNNATRNAYDHSLKMQRRTREMYKSYPSGYNGERKASIRNMYRQKQKFPWKTIDNEDAWDYCSARGVTGENVHEYFKNAGNNTAKKNCKYSDVKHDFDAQMKSRSPYLIVGWDKSFLKVLLIFSLVAFIWNAFGAQLALTYFVFFMPLNKEHTAWYKLACVVAWLIGGHRGLALQYGISTTGWLYGKAHDVALAATLLGLWIAGFVTDFITLPYAMVLFMICMYASIKASH